MDLEREGRERDAALNCDSDPDLLASGVSTTVKAGRLFPVNRRSLLFSIAGSKVFVGSLVVRNAPFFKCAVPVLASVSKESDAGPPLSSSEGIPGSFSESQLDILKNPAVPAFDRSLRVRARGGVGSGVPPPLGIGSGAEAAVHAVAGEMKGIIGLPEGLESDLPSILLNSLLQSSLL